MKKSVACFVLAALFVLSFFSGCASSGGEFTVLAAHIPQNLDPQLAKTTDEQTAVINLFEGLYRHNTTGQPVLAAAESVDISADGLIYTFALREGAVWPAYTGSGGETPVTADDFVFAFQRIFNRQTASPWAQDFAGIVNAAEVLAGSAPAEALGVWAKDDRTLVIQLTAADAAFPYKLCSAGAMPCNRAFFEKTGGEYGLSYRMLLVNGPFSIYRWTPGEALTLSRNEKGPGASRVVFSAPEKEDGRSHAARYAAGEGSGALIPADNADAAGATATWVLLFNTRAHPLLGELAARQALAAVAADALQAMATRAEGLVPPGIGEGGESYRAKAGSVLHIADSPAALMRSALTALADENESYADTPHLTVLVAADARAESATQTINAAWQAQLACYFGVEAQDISDVEALVAAGSYDIALLPLYAATGEAADMLATFANGGLTGWQGGVFSAALNEAQAAQNAAERLTLCADAERLLLQGAAVAPLFYETSAFVTREKTANLWASSIGPVLDFCAPEA